MTAHPQRLVSLWDMLHIELSELANSTAVISEYLEFSRLCVRRNIEMTLSQEFRTRVKGALDNVQVIAARLELPVTVHLAEKAQKDFHEVGEQGPTVGGTGIALLRASFTDLQATIYKELSERSAVVVPQGRVGLFVQEQPLFGQTVSLKFAKVSTDISEAGKCLALERPTACVFHLMRVVEYAVQRLGKKLHVEIDVEKETWYQITLHINKAMDAMPGQTAPQQRAKQKIGAAAAHLNAVRIATRNDVMHPKATYTDEEAQTLFDATKALMQQMAKIV